MTTPEPATPSKVRPEGANAWREVIQSGAESAAIAGLALEHLIDLQRSRSPRSGDET